MMMSQRICLISQKFLTFALKFSSIQFQDWGHAMLAELQTIEKPLAALLWSAGCVLVVLRKGLPGKFNQMWSTVVEYLKEKHFMRDAKITAITTVAVTLLLFAFTNFRQAMSVAAESLIYGPELSISNFHDAEAMQDKISTSEMDRLRKAATQKGDAKLLAYVAVNDPRPAVAQTVADQAVSLDPQRSEEHTSELQS